jgi:membrane-bound lytic murein transglycosylase F
MQTRIFPLLGVLLVLGACGRPAPPPEHSGELVVGTRNSPASYYIDHNGEPAGFEHDLIQAFADSQSWNLSWVEKNRPEALWEQVNLTRVHMAAAGLPLKVVESRKLKAGPVLYETPVHVVYRLAERKPRKVSDLYGKRIGMIIGSGHTPMLMRLKRKHPELQWEALENVWPEELLVQLREGRYDAVVISGMDFDLSRKFFPELAVAFDFEETQKIVWAMPAHTSKAFIEKVRSFVEAAHQDGTIKRIHERYFGHVKRLDSTDIAGILQRRPQRLPQYRPYFQEAQTLSGIDWRLLAAIGYQESQWDPNAVSPTGVRGLMMLTGQTADRMGVNNRLDPRQSIIGGARYLALLKDSLPPRISEPDRTWLALAAYNQGLGHLQDARRIAEARGGDPDSWIDVKQALPLLSRGGYSHVTRYGYARGFEALTFVENIRNYYDILLRIEPGFDPVHNLSREADPGSISDWNQAGVSASSPPI